MSPPRSWLPRILGGPGSSASSKDKDSSRTNDGAPEAPKAKDKQRTHKLSISLLPGTRLAAAAKANPEKFGGEESQFAGEDEYGDDIAYIEELRNEGYSAEDMKHLGISAETMKQVGFTARELRAANYTYQQVKAAGYSPEAIKLAGFGATISWSYSGFTWTSTIGE
jgi:hypothetical protein